MTSKDLLKNILVSTLFLGATIGAFIYTSQKLQEEQTSTLYSFSSSQLPNIHFVRRQAIKMPTSSATASSGNAITVQHHTPLASGHSSEVTETMQPQTHSTNVYSTVDKKGTPPVNSSRIESMRRQVITSSLSAYNKSGFTRAKAISQTDNIADSEPFSEERPESTPLMRVDGGGGIGNPDEPIEEPIGEGIACLALLSLVYVFLKKRFN